MGAHSNLLNTVSNNANEVYGEDSICVGFHMIVDDCLPAHGTPRCYQRQVVEDVETNTLAFNIVINGKQLQNMQEYS